MLSTLFLPQVVLNVPQFLLFTKWGWVDSYLPLVVPSFFACDTYFVFMLVQFMRGISRELEEAAEIDGCNSFKRFIYVVLPMVQPSLVSCALFQFMWSSNDFMGPLIYLNSTKKFTASLGLRMIMDTESGFDWNKTLALSVITLIPSLIIFFLAQDQFVEGIAAGGVKG
jgi:oligogalacturonide transport system permease protein